MAIISQETWDKFTKEEKQQIQHMYADFTNKTEAGESIIAGYEDLFGKENLQPKPKTPKIWADVEESENLLSINYDRRHTHLTLDNNIVNTKVIDKIIATYKIAHLINKSYGGMVTKEEWKKSVSYNREDIIWTIVCEYDENKELQLRVAANWAQPELVSFHTEQQAEEFMSYPENLQLIKDYYMI